MNKQTKHRGWSVTAWVGAVLCAALCAAGCAPPKHAPPILGIAIDLSGSTRGLESNETANVNQLIGWAMRTKADVFLTAIGTTSRAHSTPLLQVNFDVSDGGNPLTRSTKQNHLKDAVDRALKQAYARPRGGSDILGAVVAEAQELATSGGTRPKVFAVVSDGWNFGDDHQLRFTSATLRESAATLVHRARQDDLVPDLSGISAIYFGGAGQASDNAHSSPEVARLQDFWLAFFAAAKGPVPQYAALLSLPTK